MHKDEYTVATSQPLVPGTVASFTLPDTADAASIDVFVSYTGSGSATVNLYELSPSGEYYSVDGRSLVLPTKVSLVVDQATAEDYVLETLTSSSGVAVSVTTVNSFD